MKKKSILLITVLLSSIIAYGQERIFSLGYGKTFVTNDSSTINITFDLNRIPGQTKKAAGYYFLNEVFGKSRWGYYIKPTMDVNIGSGVTSAPNNISVGLPIGIVYDLRSPISEFFLGILMVRQSLWLTKLLQIISTTFR